MREILSLVLLSSIRVSSGVLVSEVRERRGEQAAFQSGYPAPLERPRVTSEGRNAATPRAWHLAPGGEGDIGRLSV